MSASRRIQRGFEIHPDWVEPLAHLNIVLVGTTHAGNIGAVARVMKNMALSKLTLVSSTYCGPETEALPLASGAYEIIENAERTELLEHALLKSVMAVGASARLGGKRIGALTPEEIIPKLMEATRMGPTAMVFGRESKGLTNEELKLCSHQMIIPTNAEFASMNLAQAVAITASEIFKFASRPVGFRIVRRKQVSLEAKEQMFEHIENVLLRAGFLNKSNPLTMMRDIRRIFNSADLDERDAKIIRGIFRKVENSLRISDMKLKKYEDASGDIR